eukprot:GFUD01117186.1.p1 GENE.GFUD01117186.1~~GFUD01117186.1.p1  ORF type:complete len:365 (+),score=56.46 GFUD01117186.1:174-1268(+)
MALSAKSVHSSNPENTQLQPHNKIDIHGVLRSSCSNCTECPQFVSIPGHVLCAYCGCPPARHGKADPGSVDVSSLGVPPLVPVDRKRGRDRDMSADSVGRVGRVLIDSEWDSEQDSEGGSDSEETSSGVSSSASNRGARRQRRRWRPSWQVTAPPPRVSSLLEVEPVGREVQLEHSWNELDSSPNIYVKPEDPLTFHRNPVYQTSDAIRGKCGSEGDGYSCGLHVWAVHWPSASRGTHPVVGVATRDCHLTEPGYKRLVGSTETSWGWCLKTMKVYHDSRKFRLGVPYPRDIDEKLRVPDTFYMILDMDRGTLAFQANNDFLGVAFSGLRGEELFPIVSAVWGHCEVSLTYVGCHQFERERSLA